VKPLPIEESQVNPRDPDASFTLKSDETYFGYKADLAVDEERGLVRRAEMTSVDLHYSLRGEGHDPGRREGLLCRQGLRLLIPAEAPPIPG
jgi:hypothetical protein